MKGHTEIAGHMSDGQDQRLGEKWTDGGSGSGQGGADRQPRVIL